MRTKNKRKLNSKTKKQTLVRTSRAAALQLTKSCLRSGKTTLWEKAFWVRGKVIDIFIDKNDSLSFATWVSGGLKIGFRRLWKLWCNKFKLHGVLTDFSAIPMVLRFRVITNIFQIYSAASVQMKTITTHVWK